MNDVRRYIQQEMMMCVPIEVVLAEDFDRLKAREQELVSVVREFAGFFSSDEERHWELLRLASGDNG